ncbi:MAG: hypothetical protein ACE5F6_00270 [Anaerolineae bacterium]
MIFHFYSYSALQTLLSVLLAKGDVLTRDGSGNLVRVPVGLDGQQLTANGADPNGIDWQAGTVAPVDTVFGRVGNVVAALSDYDASQVDNDSGVAGGTVKDALDTLAALILTPADKDLVARVTAADGAKATNSTISGTPTGYVLVMVNGLLVTVGDGVKTKECYFSGDAGVTARTISAIVAGDELYWNGSVAGYQLDASDRISLNYET